MAGDATTFSPSSPMVTTPPSEPPAAAADYEPQIQEALRGSRESIGRARESMAQEADVARGRERALEPMRQRYMAQLEQPLPQRPTAKATPPAPQRNEPGADETWLMASMLLGALAGAFTRRHLTNALGAMSGAIQGYQEGSLLKFNQNMQIWEAEHKRTVEANQQALDDYRAILENRKLTENQLHIELQLAAQKYDDRAMATAAQTKNDLVIAQLYDKESQALERLKIAGDRWSQQHQTWREQQFAEAAKQYYDQNPGILQSILSYQRAPPSATPRTGSQGAYDRELWSRIVAADPNFQAGGFEARKGAMKTAEQIPVRAQQAREVSAARTLGTAGENIKLVMQSASRVIPQADAAAQNVPTTAFPRINELIQAGARLVGDPALRRFQMANLELQEMLARALNPRSAIVAVANMNRAGEFISTADSPEAYRAMLQQVNSFITNQYQAVQDEEQGKPFREIELPPLTSRTLQPTPRQMLPRTGGTTGMTPPTAANPVPIATLPPTSAATATRIPGYSVGRGMAPAVDPLARVAPRETADMPMLLPEGRTLEELLR